MYAVSALQRIGHPFIKLRVFQQDMRPQTFAPQHAEQAQTYLDAALGAGSKRVAGLKKVRGAERVDNSRRLELERLATVRNVLTKSLMQVHDSYPSFDHMSEFITQLFEQELEVAKVRQALGGINGACNTVTKLTGDFINQIKDARTVDVIVRLRSTYIARLASFVKQIDKHVDVLNRAREILRDLPSIDDEMFTVAIAGFPNVGKSTLLSKLTTAKPEIKPYAFTTKGLNVGYFDYRYLSVQCIDTPGTLNRTRINPIERKAEIALKYLAKIIVYVFDPMEGAYSLDEQKALYAATQRYDIPIIIYVSKTDIAKQPTVTALLEEFPDACTDAEAVRKEIIKQLRKDVTRR
jgi:nucleolar GTP-binding protein